MPAVWPIVLVYDMSTVWPMLHCIYRVHYVTYVMGTYHARHVTHAVGIGCVRRVTYPVGIWYVCRVTHSVGTWYVLRLTYAMGPWVVRHMPYAVDRYNVRPGTYVVGFWNVRHLNVIDIHHAFHVIYAVVIWYDLGWWVYGISAVRTMLLGIIWYVRHVAYVEFLYHAHDVTYALGTIMPAMWSMFGHMIYARYMTHIAGMESISFIYHISSMKVFYIMVIMSHSVTSPIANYVYRKSLIEIYLVYSFVIIGIYFSYLHAFILYSLANSCVAVSIN